MIHLKRWFRHQADFWNRVAWWAIILNLLGVLEDIRAWLWNHPVPAMCLTLFLAGSNTLTWGLAQQREHRTFQERAELDDRNPRKRDEDS